MKIAAIHTTPQVEQISVSVSDSARFVSDVRDAAAELGEVLADEVERAERDIADGQLEQRMDWDEVLNGLILEL